MRDHPNFDPEALKHEISIMQVLQCRARIAIAIPQGGIEEGGSGMMPWCERGARHDMSLVAGHQPPTMHQSA